MILITWNVNDFFSVTWNKIPLIIVPSLEVKWVIFSFFSELILSSIFVYHRKDGEIRVQNLRVSDGDLSAETLKFWSRILPCFLYIWIRSHFKIVQRFAVTQMTSFLSVLREAVCLKENVKCCSDPCDLSVPPERKLYQLIHRTFRNDR